VTFAALLASPGVEERLVLGGRFGFLAFHGGLEGGTAEVASAAAAQAGASLYAVIQPPDLLWHIPSHRVDPAVSDALAAFLSHVDVAVAVHGYGRPDRPSDVLLGGGNRGLARHVASHLRPRLDGFVVVDDIEAIPVEMRGLHPSNPANLATQGGVQLELPPAARGASPRMSDRGRPCRPVGGLVEALTDAARSWPPAGSSRPEVPPART
jgi:phage replication-related protein YjqB (UPF0714/DUF867 family)